MVSEKLWMELELDCACLYQVLSVCFRTRNRQNQDQHSLSHAGERSVAVGLARRKSEPV